MNLLKEPSAVLGYRVVPPINIQKTDAVRTVVWLHGFLGNLAEWLPIVRALPDYQHILIDLPAHGSSQAVVVEDMAACEGLLRATVSKAMQESAHWQRGTEEYALAGYSLGGRLALYHALHHPDHAEDSRSGGVRALLVEGGNLGLPTEAERRLRREHDARWAERLRQEPLERVLEAWYQQPVFADLTHEERSALIALRCGQASNGEQPDAHYSNATNEYNELCAANVCSLACCANQEQSEQREETPSGVALAAMLEATSLGRQPFLLEALRRAVFPWHYVCGAQDRLFRQRAEGYQLPVHVIPHAGHNAHRANPQGFLQVARAWLTQAFACGDNVLIDEPSLHKENTRV